MANSQYMCSVVLPLVADKDFVLFDLISTNFWCNEFKTQRCRMNIPTLATLDSMTGDIYFPNECFGQNPIVCTLDVYETSSREKMCKGLVTVIRQILKYVKLKFTSRTDIQVVAHDFS